MRAALPLARLIFVWHSACSAPPMGATHSPPEMEAEFREVGEERSADRRGRERRARKQRFDSLFAATLINQVAPESCATTRSYPRPAASRRTGVKINLTL